MSRPRVQSANLNQHVPHSIVTELSVSYSQRCYAPTDANVKMTSLCDSSLQKVRRSHHPQPVGGHGTDLDQV
eukprot:530488-Rhodomonas_salina.2